jgi:3-hydroxybutyryl-CoA dehydratase
MAFRDLAVGQSASMAKTITAADIQVFADLTGDHNPMHLDPAWAARGRFKERVAHGMLSAGLVSAVLGMKLPGPGALYMSQSIKFVRPVRIGDTITARAEILELVPEKRRVRLATTCTNQQGETVLEGEALLKVDEVPPAPPFSPHP